MTKQVRFDKKTRVVRALAQRIERGELGPGVRLPGEHELAAQFDVSRGTLREALTELKRCHYIATQMGVGSIVTYDGVPLPQGAGWAQALAAGATQVRTELLSLARAERPELAVRYGTAQFVLVERRRRAADGTLVSLERALVPARDGLEHLPEQGLVQGSLAATLAAHGFQGGQGNQWVGAEPLGEQAAAQLQRPAGTVFLKAVRETFDSRGRFMEQVESLLDPAHFQLHLSFGAPQ
ncbi:GntR family transcriptional regulator [Pseudomonas typographi]|uniref:GntR family transcriptional regulator n=1 Tax=Pseudomonas typographi TaxID=2715964 RepID=A0ABR7Z7U3_9PSED|nr:GntR family transcriptional regulator [Pseudomonas typographi]MBD1554658.1 GntR family transcriptional regulator [Pseudomonas typographi]MBD1587138.1 GntR family transcriptional regulator [Pseudomonas typographi]MBD1601413.1 GntR family transcriptional regulator [Pseudomonas typographi]